MSIKTTRMYVLIQWSGILAFRIVGVKTNYSTKEIVFCCFFVLFCFFEKGGAHAPVSREDLYFVPHLLWHGTFWGIVGRTTHVLVAFYNNQEVYCGLIQNRIPHAVIINRLQKFRLILDAYDCGPWEESIFIVLELMWYSSDDSFAKAASKACPFLGSALKISYAANGPLDLDPLL